MSQRRDSCVLDIADLSCQVHLAISSRCGGTVQRENYHYYDPPCGSFPESECDENHTKRIVKDVLLVKDDLITSPCSNRKYSVDVVPPMEPTSAAQRYSIVERYTHRWPYNPSVMLNMGKDACKADVNGSTCKCGPVDQSDDTYSREMANLQSLPASSESGHDIIVSSPDQRVSEDNTWCYNQANIEDSLVSPPQHQPTVEPSFENDGQGVND
ncbi:hypothetical protein K439DRAFT_1623707 [Ramaria rubella]|nr:hypothetical protein K439DRAFT_1623707 [Ramaria rubella]